VGWLVRVSVFCAAAVVVFCAAGGPAGAAAPAPDQVHVSGWCPLWEVSGRVYVPGGQFDCIVSVHLDQEPADAVLDGAELAIEVPSALQGVTVSPDVNSAGAEAVDAVGADNRGLRPEPVPMARPRRFRDRDHRRGGDLESLSGGCRQARVDIHSEHRLRRDLGMDQLH